MKKKELQYIISQGENEQVEFKEQFNKQVIETIVAFASTEGGQIFIGVTDDNQIKGIKINSETLQNWSNQIKLSTEPAVFPDIDLIEIESKTIAHIRVSEFPVKPISVKGKYYKRVKNSNHQMNLTEISDEHLMIEFIITGEAQHEERFDYPLDAIREIVVNMIVHRDYKDSSGSIIKIYDNKIEFFNPGKLFGGITISDLLSDNYTSQTRNKLIAKAFKETGIIERYGTGIKRVIDICEDYGVIPPKFEEVFNGFKVTLFKEKLNDPLSDPFK